MQRKRRSVIQNILGVSVTVTFLSVLFLSLFQMPAGMDMYGKMSGCPFMSHEEVLCSMGTLDHISAWQSAFTAIAPLFVLLFLTFTAAAIALAVAPNRLLRQSYQIQQLSRDVRERIYSFSYRPFQELFSSGILHPKLF